MDQFLRNLLMEKKSTFKSILSMGQKRMYHWSELSEAGWSVKRRCTQTASNGHTRSHICTVLFSIFISQQAAFVTGMRKMTETRVLFFFLILLTSVLQTKPPFTLFSCSAVVTDTVKAAWGHVQFSTTSDHRVTQLGWKEKRKQTKLVILSLFPGKWTVWVKWWYRNFYWRSKIREQFKGKKWRTMLGCISDYRCGDW